MHAVAIAEALEINRVICPAACGVLSAWGISVAGRRRDRSRSLVQPLDQLDSEQLAELEGELADAAASELGLTTYETEATYELRYAGQAFELPVSAAHDQLGDAFHAAHQERFGFSEPAASVELVTVRVSVSNPAGVARVPDSEVRSGTPPGSRQAWFGGRSYEAAVVFDAPPRDDNVEGPALIEQSQATIVVPPGWIAASIGADIVLDRKAAA
jgi:N-methylhydantoinase A